MNLNVPTPSFANASSRSAFGFRSMAIPETVQMDHPQDDEHHFQDSDSDMADDIYDDANKMNEDANITNESTDEKEG